MSRGPLRSSGVNPVPFLANRREGRAVHRNFKKDADREQTIIIMYCLVRRNVLFEGHSAMFFRPYHVIGIGPKAA
jgi:hypothetical protein